MYPFPYISILHYFFYGISKFLSWVYSSLLRLLKIISLFSFGNKIVFVVLLGIFSFSLSSFGTPLSVYLGERRILFTETTGKPFIDDQDRTQVPLRIVSEAFGADVLWFPKEQKVLLHKLDTQVEVFVGKNYIIKNNQKLMIDSPPLLRNGRVYLPIRPVLEAFGTKVTWNPDNSSILITLPTPSIPYEELTLDMFLSLPLEERVSYSKMDLRKFDIISTPKDQLTSSNCWAFSGIGSLEGNFFFSDSTLDFSEDHLIWNTEDNTVNYDSGGYNYLVENYLTSGKGPVSEEDDPYGDFVTVKDLTSEYLVKGFLYPDASLDSMKAALSKYGAVGASMYIGEIDSSSGEDTLYRYFDSKYNSFYYDGVLETNHDVVIVGWDDNFPKEHFIRPAPIDGAFIVKNSYGSNWGENGFFYISYADTRFPIDPGIVSMISPKEDSQQLYFHDSNGYQSTLGYLDNDPDFMAAIFTRKETKEKITHISLNIASPKIQYKLYVIPSYEGTLMSLHGAIKVSEGVLWEKGYHTISLPVSFTLGERFAVVASLYTEEPSLRLAIDPFTDEKLQNDVFPDQSYTSSNGIHWMEGYNEYDSAQSYDVCLRAHTIISK